MDVQCYKYRYFLRTGILYLPESPSSNVIPSGRLLCPIFQTIRLLKSVFGLYNYKRTLSLSLVLYVSEYHHFHLYIGGLVSIAYRPIKSGSLAYGHWAMQYIMAKQYQILLM